MAGKNREGPVNTPIMPVVPPKKMPWKKPIYITSGLLLSLGVVIGLGPTLISTKWGASYLAKKVSDKTHGNLQIQSLSLSWLAGQEIEGITYSDNTGGIFASCQKIKTDSSLLALLFGEHQLGNLILTSPHLKLKKELLSYEKISGPQIAESSMLYLPPITPLMQKILFPFSGTITIKEGAIDVMANGIDPVYIHDIESTVFLATDKSRISLELKANSTQQNQQGSISLQGQLQDLQTANPKLSLQSSVVNLPIKALDQIASLIEPKNKGLLSDALGESLSFTLNGNLSKASIDLQLSASSQNLQAEISTLSNGSAITLKSPAKGSLTLSADLMRRFLPEYKAVTPAKLELSISSVKIPVSESGIDLQGMEIHSQISLSPIAFSGASIGPLTANLDATELQKELTLTLSAPLQNTQNAQIVAKASALGLFSVAPTASVTLQLSKIPSALINSLAASPMPSGVLGSSIDALVKVEYAEEISHLHLSLQTPTAAIKNAHFTLGSHIQLQEPFNLTLTPTDELYATLFPGGEVIGGSSTPLQVSIESLALPTLADASKVKMKAKLQAPLLSYKKFFAFSPYSIENLSSDITISTMEDISIDLKSSLFALSIEGAYREKESTFIAKKPIFLSYLITDTQIASVLHKGERPYLAGPVAIKAQIEPTTIHFTGDILSTSTLKANASIGSILLQNKDGSKQTSLEKTSLSFEMNGPANELKAQILSAFTKTPSSSSKIEASLKASSFLKNGSLSFDSAQIASDIQLVDIPTSLMQMLTSEKLPLQAFIGNTLNLTAHVDTRPTAHDITLDVTSTYLQLQGALSVKDGAISLQKIPCNASLTLTPDSYLVLDNLLTHDAKAPPFTLSEKSTFSFNISELYVPYNFSPCAPNTKDSCLAIDIKNSIIAGSFDNGSLSFADGAGKQAIVLKGTRLSFQKPKGDAPLKLQASSEANTTSSKQLQNGSLQVNAELSDIYSESGELDFSHLSSKADINIQKLPSAALDLFARSLGSNPTTFTSIFGSSITASLSLTLQDASGPIKMNINSPSTRASLAGKLTNGTLTLSEPIYAQITMTEELSRYLLGGVNPLSITEIKSSNPITLEVQPAGFSLPLTSFAKNKINIPTARIELGQISCKNEGNLNIALSLLKSVQVSQNKHLNLWFTPIDLHISQGVVNVERTDILIAETFDIALWGVIDPVKNNVNMILGLTADCLARAFSINNLPEDYVLQVPMTGTLDNVEINKTKATAKIAALLAWQQAAIAGGSAGGPAGAVFGHFLNKLGSLPLNDQDTPPPKRPFAWENEGNSKPKSQPKKKETSQRYKKAHIQKDDKPLKQLWKIVR